MLIRDIGLWFSFFVLSLPGLGIRVMLASQHVRKYSVFKKVLIPNAIFKEIFKRKKS